MKSHEVTILSAVDELQRAYKALNIKYFSGQLEKTIITVQTDTTSSAYAWISVGKVWSDKDQREYREINLVAEHLNRAPELVIASLLHEMCHLYNLQRGVQDCSRSGTYHNQVFRDTAEAHGLRCERSERYGWCVTSPTDELSSWVAENCRKGCFRYRRAATYKNGKPKTTKPGTDGKPITVSRTKQSSRKYVCPCCGLIVRATRNLTGKLLCIDCDMQLEESI